MRYKKITESYNDAIQAIANDLGFTESSPIQPLHRVPKGFEGIRNAHNGTHHFLIIQIKISINIL